MKEDGIIYLVVSNGGDLSKKFIVPSSDQNVEECLDPDIHRSRRNEGVSSTSARHIITIQL
jgi:hypothetical protein